jgi:hypothetical protein
VTLEAPSLRSRSPQPIGPAGLDYQIGAACRRAVTACR